MLRQIRNQFLEFFESKGHLIKPSAGIKPQNDPTLLFVNSGMAPMKKYFLGKEEPESKRITNSQLCLRVGGKHNDLADVGYTKRHHTFFEMLGNFSFGDYFQKEAIPYAWEFLTQVMKIDQSRLYVTVHPDDCHAYAIWEKIIAPDRIIKLKENIWSMGDVGPFGYCSEIFYDLKKGTGDFSNGDRYLEIWNIVFMKKYTDGVNITDLEKPCIDAGMGLERLVSVMEGLDDNYDISFFKQVLPYLKLQANTSDSKIFLDHLRSIAFLISSDIMPGAGSREYVVRRLIRRALKSFFTFEDLDLRKVVYGILNAWQSSYDFEFDIEKIYKVLNDEKQQFEKILENGTKIFEEFYTQDKHFDAQKLFLLHDTYGFSIDIAVDLLKARHCTYDFDGFEKLMEQAREKNRQETKHNILPYDDTEYVDSVELDANIIGFYEDNIILNRTPFYAQSGGQIGDTGYIEGDGFKIEIIDTKKIGSVVIHKFLGTGAKLGKIRATIYNARRTQIRAHHSATHLLHKVLADILGKHVHQQGSYVCENRLRLDFSHPEALSYDIILQIERTVNQLIQKNWPTKISIMSYQEAIDSGAVALFDYEDNVRVVNMGASTELCGGSHVCATGDIGLFKIIKYSAISAGVKRIEATVAEAAVEFMQKQALLIRDISQHLHTNEEDILNKISILTNKKVENNFIVHVAKIGALHIGFCEGDIDIEKQMKEHNLDILCTAVKIDEKVAVKLKLKNLPYDAKVITKELGTIIAARGLGGRKDFAQTGGFIDDTSKIFEKLKTIILKLQ